MPRKQKRLCLKKPKDMLGEIRKLVKVAVAQNDWLTFGIGDKK